MFCSALLISVYVDSRLDGEPSIIPNTYNYVAVFIISLLLVI